MKHEFREKIFIIIVFIFSLFQLNLPAQLDLTLPLSYRPISPQVEFKLKGSYFMAIGAGYYRGNHFDFEFDTINMKVEQFTFPQDYYNTSLYLRKYFGKNKLQAKGFYVNSYTRLEWVFEHNPDYLSYLEMKPSSNYPAYPELRDPFTALHFGIGLGYKWVLWDRLIISPQIRTSLEYFSIIDGFGGPLGDFQLRLGYRFSKSSKETFPKINAIDQ